MFLYLGQFYFSHSFWRTILLSIVTGTLTISFSSFFLHFKYIVSPAMFSWKSVDCLVNIPFLCHKAIFPLILYFVLWPSTVWLVCLGVGIIEFITVKIYWVFRIRMSSFFSNIRGFQTLFLQIDFLPLYPFSFWDTHHTYISPHEGVP